MQIRCYNFLKKHNSTVRPEASAIAVTFEVDLKRNTSINNPIFLLDIGDAAFNFNYIYWPEMGTYYFVDDVIYGNTYIKEIVCSCDVLATARQYIINQSAFVKYSSLNYDPYIKDDRVQPTSDIETVAKYNSFAGLIARPTNSGTYCYLFTTINTEGVTSYVVSWNSLVYLGNEIIANATDIIGNLKQFFQSAKDSILKVQCIPWSLSGLQGAGVVGSNASYIQLGSYNTLIEGYKVSSNGVLVSSDFIDIPTRPDDFTRIEPYCEGKMHLPLLGDIDLSLSEVQDVNKLYFTYISNVLSGDTTCVIYKGSSDIDKATIITTVSGNVNFELPMGYVAQLNPSGTLSGAAGVGAAVAAVVTGGSAAVVAGGISAAVASFGSYLTKTSSSVGGYGGNASAFDTQKMSVVLYKHGLTVDPADLTQLYGRPCGKVLNLSTLVNGYVQTSEFELQAPFDEEMTSQVNRLMDNGVYLY